MSSSIHNDHSACINHAVREQLLVLDADLSVKAASKSFYTAFKVGPDQTLGKMLSELGNGQWNIHALLTLLKELPEMDGEFDDLEMEHDFPQLGRRTMLVSARRLQGENAQTGMILLSIRDTTGQRRAETEVGELLTRFRTTLASIGDAVIVTDPQSRITFMNPTAEKLTGWVQNDALQKHLTDIFKIVNEQSAKAVESPVAKAIRDGAIVGLANHTVLIARDGTEWPIDDSAAPIRDAAGRIVGVVLVFHDITNRRKAEQELEISEIRYRRLFESAHDGILIVDAETAKILEVNRFMVDLMGFPREYFLGKELWELGVFHDEESNKAAMEELQKVGHIRYDDLPLEHKDGRQIPVEFVSNVYREGRQSVIQCNIRDITERKNASAVQARLAAIVESSSDAIVSKTLDGIIVTWNHGAECMLGYTASEVVGRPVTMLIPADLPDEESKILTSLRCGQRVENYETTRVTKDGRRIEVSLSSSPVRNSEGRVIGGSKILRDITEHKLAEVTLRHSEARWSALIISGLDCIIGMDNNGIVTEFNPAAEATFGYRRSDVVGKVLADLIIPPAFREAHLRGLEAYRQTGGGPMIGTRMEVTAMKADGSEFPAELAITPVNIHDAPGCIACLRDITDRKNAVATQARLAAIVESSGDAIISETLDGLIATWNPAAACIFGYTAEEIVGRPMSLLLPPQRPEEERPIMDRLDCGEGVTHCETLRMAKDGRLIDVSLSVSRIKDSADKIVGASHILRDITGKKRAEVELSIAKDAAETANRSKSEFLANMSHEIRTPMTAIVGFAERLLHNNQDEAGRNEYIQIIRRNASHLLEIINEILDLSKIEASQMTVENIECDLPDLLSELISLLRPRAGEKGLGFEITFEGPIPHLIRTDPMRLRQILVNLLGNAVKFTLAGKIGMRVTDEGAGSDGIKLRIDVIDSGIGMSPELIDRLFQPFAQGDESITRKFGGTGLGLTISRRLARLLKGDVTVTSVPGSGSTFTLTVDGGLSAGVEMLQGLTEATLRSKIESAVHPHIELNGRILLVEDGRDNQRLLRMQLRDAGASVFTADNGQIAVEMAAKQSFDLIVMDMQMPVMDGYAATIELRRRGLTIPIIALTAYAMAEDRSKCMASGCNAYLSKPIDEETLLKTVNQHLGNDHSPTPSDTAQTGAAGAPTPPAAADGSERIKSSLSANPRMMKIIPEFIDGLPGEVRKMNDLLERNDLPALQQAVHQLLGAAGGYGFDPITEPATKAEESIKSGKVLEDITDEINSLIEVIRRIDGYDESKVAVVAEETAK